MNNQFELYPNLKESINNDILNYKEFNILKVDNLKNKDYNNDEILDIINKEDNLMMENYQLFVNNFFNPITPYNKLLINFQTGSGKTLTALTTAKQYIDVNKDAKIIIIGFTKNIFKYELATKKIFNVLNEHDRKAFKTDKTYLWKVNKAIKHNFLFFGYQQLFNALFIFNNSKTNNSDNEINISNMKKKDIIKAIEDGKIKVNKQILDQFENALVICDEVHNLYNVLEPNNWAIAIMFIFNYYPKIKSLFLSATPLKHNSKEIVSLINLLNEKDKQVKYGDIFDKETKLLTPQGETLIKDRIYGKICYVNILNIFDYPEKIFRGESLINQQQINYFLNYFKLKKTNKNLELFNNVNSIFKFVKCPISDKIENFYKSILKSNDNQYVLTSENKYIIDYLIPDNSESKTMPFLLKSDEIKQTYKRSISTDLFLTKDNVLSGNMLEFNTLKNISPKYFKLVEILNQLLTNAKSGKIMIFHPFVHNSGVLFIEEVLKYNGFISYNSPINKNTKCATCGIINVKHINITGHKYTPAQFINLYGMLNKNIIDNLSNIYNSEDNKYGSTIKILLASSLLQEGYNFKAVRHLFITHSPTNISTMQQIIGRTVRKNSHKYIEDKKVDIYILTHTFKDKSLLSYEEYFYLKKILEYQKIQYINALMYNNAIDFSINNSINTYDMPLNQNLIKNLNQNLNESKNESKTLKIQNLNNLLYNNIFLDQTLYILKYIIKRLFLEVSPIFEYNDLYNTVKSTPFKVPINTQKIDENTFNLAIYELIYNYANKIVFNKTKFSNDFSDLLLNDSLIFYDRNNNEVVIKQHNNYLFLTKFNEKHKNININDYLIQLNDDVTINISNIMNNSKVKIKTIISKMIELLDNKKDKMLYEKQIIYNFLYTDQLQIIEYIIENYDKHNDKFNKILNYYSKYNYIIYDNKTPIGHKLNKSNYRIYKNNNWENDYNLIKPVYKFDKYLIYHELINGYISQKLFILSKANKHNKKLKDLRLIYKGSICASLSKEDIEHIFKYFHLENNNIPKIDKCVLLENTLLNNQSKEFKYFLNLNEFHLVNI